MKVWISIITDEWSINLHCQMNYFFPLWITNVWSVEFRMLNNSLGLNFLSFCKTLMTIWLILIRLIYFYGSLYERWLNATENQVYRIGFMAEHFQWITISFVRVNLKFVSTYYWNFSNEFSITFIIISTLQHEMFNESKTGVNGFQIEL